MIYSYLRKVVMCCFLWLLFLSSVALGEILTPLYIPQTLKPKRLCFIKQTALFLIVRHVNLNICRNHHKPIDWACSGLISFGFNCGKLLYSLGVFG